MRVAPLIAAAALAVVPASAAAAPDRAHGPTATKASAGKGAKARGAKGARHRPATRWRRPARTAARPVSGLWADVPIAGELAETVIDPVTGIPAPVRPTTTTKPPTGGGTWVPDLPGQSAHSVAVRSTEFAFTLSQPSVRAGDVTVTFDNSRAEDPHELATHELPALAIGLVGPETVVERTFTLRPGTYTLYCPIPTHEARGMRATLTVSP